LFGLFESLKVGYICGGKIYDDITEYISSIDRSFCGHYENKDQFGIMWSLGIDVEAGKDSVEQFFDVLSMKTSRWF